VVGEQTRPHHDPASADQPQAVAAPPLPPDLAAQAALLRDRLAAEFDGAMAAAAEERGRTAKTETTWPFMPHPQSAHRGTRGDPSQALRILGKSAYERHGASARRFELALDIP